MLIVRKNFSKTEEKEKKGKKTGIKVGGGTIALGAAAVGAEKAANKLGEKAGEIVTGQAKGNGKFVKLSGNEIILIRGKGLFFSSCKANR